MSRLAHTQGCAAGESHSGCANSTRKEDKVKKGTLCLVVRPPNWTIYPNEEKYIGRTCITTGAPYPLGPRGAQYCPTTLCEHSVILSALLPLAPPVVTKTTRKRKTEPVHA